ncbi:Putative Small secreted protein [Penicillium digitatum]|uniref:Small secreted protein n=3 Tax=Penicillium digitatum TaxID=36651 RepID=K9F8S6_PEND2|nr:hypothetical protein PDIP_28560 [Penicillium digitatum Pd1]EKV05820.1 hypothetical protein PDIG_80170 [Penicillium digitatum PHI26]EKV18066.1 hypothetical protein PDIP_28560 [Penicillium digitatum Pd1]KAG0155047.1 hypothetical protein PDIDSM_620 [Penicillium digitatum]QQK47046.1 Putative Small secreted protein [Penicillium digitatum]
MQLTNLIALLIAPAIVAATLHPASSNTKGYRPSRLNCGAAKVSRAIQAAECSHNTRTSTTQTFAVFETDHQYDSSHGAPYGTCTAYTCAPPASHELVASSDSWIFYWGNGGNSAGFGTTCIKSPKTGECGCENSNGVFVAGSNSCV